MSTSHQIREAVPWRRMVCLALVFLILAGCTAPAVRPDRISREPHASGNDQAGLCNQRLPKPLRVLVEGPNKRGVLGGAGSRPMVPMAEVVFQVENEASGAVFADTGLPTTTAITDAGGMAQAELVLGNVVGDVRVSASVETPAGPKRTTFRAITGVELIGNDLEGPTGGEIEAFGVRLVGCDNLPVPGVNVFFRTEGSASGSRMGASVVVTDADGRAVTNWQLSDSTQRNFASVEIQDDRSYIPEPDRYHVRSIEFVAMAIDKKTMLISLLGGLAVFIFGMKLMSGGLRRIADRRLKSILQSMTKNRFRAVGIGTGLTAAVQSSSAVTVMVVGFVNAGLLTLPQAIGVVFGANIGTTVTAQIIAFRLDELAYPAVIVGLLMSSLGRRMATKAAGEAILGFGLLFLGMSTMSDILKPLRYSPEFGALFHLFDCAPVNGLIPIGPVLISILIGTVTTIMVQSSSATIGLVLALASQGMLNFYTAFAVVLGDNIGTTITAILASLGGNRNAKRAAAAHTLFNVFGAAYMVALMLLPVWNGQPLFLGFVDWVTPGAVFAGSPENLTRHIANAHTLFNVFNVVLFLPFIGLMAAVVRRIVPLSDADQESILVYLEPHLLETPQLALGQAVREVAYMVRRAQKSINEGCELFLDGSTDMIKKIEQREELIDRLQEEITAYLVELSGKPMSPEEARMVPGLIHAVNDAERIGDHSMNLVELAELKRKYKHRLSDEAVADIRRLLDIINQQFAATCRALEQGDEGAVDRVLYKEGIITEIMTDASEAHVARLESGHCGLQAGVVFLDLLAHLERVGDHLMNIAERARMMAEVMQADKD